MQFRLLTLLKFVVASALIMAFWRLTGVLGLLVLSIAGLMLVLPIVLLQFGRRLGEPIMSGFIGGGVGFASQYVVWEIICPDRMPLSVLSDLVQCGMIRGGLYGVIIFFSDVILNRNRTSNYRLAFRYDIVLALFLFAIIASAVVFDEFRWVILPELMSR